MAKGSGTTKKSTSSSPKGISNNQIAGDYGLKVLGKRESVMTISGWATDYTNKPTQTKLVSYVQEYLDTGKFDMYDTKMKKVLASKIATDLRLRGAHANSEGNYVTTYDGMKVNLTKKKDGTWVASASNASNTDNSNSSMKAVLSNLSNKRKRK